MSLPRCTPAKRRARPASPAPLFLAIERIEALHPEPGDIVILHVAGGTKHELAVGAFCRKVLQPRFGALFVVSPAGWVSATVVRPPEIATA